MSSPETHDAETDTARDGATDEGRENDSVASKLSKELSNWRRRRGASRPNRPDGPSQSYQSEPARTIRVRGHETLVVRKPKLQTGKPQADSAQQTGKAPADPTSDSE
jgi:hypothetical protein